MVFNHKHYRRDNIQEKILKGLYERYKMIVTLISSVGCATNKL